MTDLSQPNSAVADNAALLAALARQRAAYLRQPVPSHAERIADLRTLERFVRENRQALTDAVSADYGHRSPHETVMTEIAPLLAAIRHTRKHLRGWMRPRRSANATERCSSCSTPAACA